MFAFSMVVYKLGLVKRFYNSSLLNDWQVPQRCLCTSRVGKQKNVADVNKNVVQRKEHRNLQVIDTAARMDHKRPPGVTAWQLIWLGPDQGQRYCYCLVVKRRLCVLQERTHLYDNQGKNLLCCDILDGNVSGAQLPEHSSVVEQLAYIRRVSGSVPSVPTRLVPPI